MNCGAIICVLLACLLAGGCESRPQAPVLRDSPLYHNEAEGIRFLVPDGWMQSASAILPPGHFEDEMFVVRYSVPTADSGAMMVLLVLSEREPIDMGQHLQGPSFRVEKWKPAAPANNLTINGAAVEHHVLTADVNGKELTKEAYVFRANERVYSFIGMFASTDDYARQQLQRAIDSLEVN